MSDTPNPATPEQVQPEPKTDALAQVAQNLLGLRPKQDMYMTLAASTLGGALPAIVYQGAGELKLTDKEKQRLSEVQDAKDDDVEIRPDGAIYVQHMTIRRAMTYVFGVEWALVPGSVIAQEKMVKPSSSYDTRDETLVCQRWVLRVKGCYIGEDLGAATFHSDNAAQDKTDAATGAQGEAIRRIAGKSSLGIFSNLWQKSFERRWKRDNAVQVWIKGKSQNYKRWRRIEDEPFDNELGPVKELQQRAGPKQEPVRTNAHQPGAAMPGPKLPDAAPEPDDAPPPDYTDAELLDAPPTPSGPAPDLVKHVYVPDGQGVCQQCKNGIGHPIHVTGQIRDTKSKGGETSDGSSNVQKMQRADHIQHGGSPSNVQRESQDVVAGGHGAVSNQTSDNQDGMVTAGNWRYFMMETRKRGLVNGAVAESAIAFLSNEFKVPLVNGTGREQIEVLKAMFKTLTATTFNEVIKKVRELSLKG